MQIGILSSLPPASITPYYCINAITQSTLPRPWSLVLRLERFAPVVVECGGISLVL